MQEQGQEALANSSKPPWDKRSRSEKSGSDKSPKRKRTRASPSIDPSVIRALKPRELGESLRTITEYVRNQIDAVSPCSSDIFDLIYITDASDNRSVYVGRWS